MMLLTYLLSLIIDITHLRWVMLLSTLVITAVTFTMQEACHDNNMFVSDDHRRTIRMSLLTAYFLLLTSYYLLPTSYLLLPTTY